MSTIGRAGKTACFSYALDTNLVENATRPVVVGRKNWLFADSMAESRARANLYGLIETAHVSCVTRLANDFYQDGFLAAGESGELTAEAASSSCGYTD
jgi:hypothetical protein